MHHNNKRDTNRSAYLESCMQSPLLKQEQNHPKQKSAKWLLLIIVAIVAILVGCTVAGVMFRRKNSTNAAARAVVIQHTLSMDAYAGLSDALLALKRAPSHTALVLSRGRINVAQQQA